MSKQYPEIIIRWVSKHKYISEYNPVVFIKLQGKKRYIVAYRSMPFIPIHENFVHTYKNVCGCKRDNWFLEPMSLDDFKNQYFIDLI